MLQKSKFSLQTELGIFGVATDQKSSRLLLLPVPWDVTTSYGGGTCLGPSAILAASAQVDLFDLELGNAYKSGYHLLPEEEKIVQLNHQLRPMVLKIRHELENNVEEELSALGQQYQYEVNEGCSQMVSWVHRMSLLGLQENKIMGLIGGDHSTPQGLIQAISEKYQGNFGILHIDAHADLRNSYQGFDYSHASIMYNVMQAKWRPKVLVQVGIRDFCEEEFNFIQTRSDIKTFFDWDLKQKTFQGSSWEQLTQEILSQLPENVYISFDIDGLSPEFCPHTGTPVPGGLSFDQAIYVIGSVVRSGRKIIGFDLNEVAPECSKNSPFEKENQMHLELDGGSEWDGNVGARILYKLCGWTVKSLQ
ncbi:MAG: agmatinase family protein [Bdellovibrionales bacterium]|nr:agmatinase family protein [Bdellovibrionales bacterium]